MPGGGSDALSGNLILTVTSIKSYSFSFLPPSKMVRNGGIEPLAALLTYIGNGFTDRRQEHSPIKLYS